MELEEGDLTAAVEGIVVKEDKVLVIRSIKVTYSLAVDPAERETAVRVHGFHAGFCPVARTLEGCVGIETELDFRG